MIWQETGKENCESAVTIIQYCCVTEAEEMSATSTAESEDIAILKA